MLNWIKSLFSGERASFLPAPAFATLGDINRTTLWTGGAVVATSDTTDLDTPSRGLYVGTAGALKVKYVNGDVVTYPNVGVGPFPAIIVRVYTTGTTAAGIVGHV